jgi:hypothetical protein
MTDIVFPAGMKNQTPLVPAGILMSNVPVLVELKNPVFVNALTPVESVGALPAVPTPHQYLLLPVMVLEFDKILPETLCGSKFVPGVPLLS